MSTMTPAQSCYHCNLPIPAKAHFPVTIANQEHLMCCPGCQAVAMAIVDGGLENFYRFRTEASTMPRDAGQAHWQIYDLPDIQADFVIELDDKQSLRQANLLLEGISCAACSWLIETHLKKNPAVKSVAINITSHRCTLVWDASQQALSGLLAALAEIGYRACPATDEKHQELVKKENRLALFRLGIAGFAMMQTVMVAVGMYTGATDTWLTFLRWLSMLIATPVVFFSCWPFYKSAYRSLKSRQLVMDVPVALAISLAYVASCWATIFDVGEVYFESVSMFAFFLLLGRYIEMRARHRNRLAFGNLAQLMPLSACCLIDDPQDGSRQTQQQVPLKALRAGDRVLVKAGETFPCDGLVETGESRVVEAILTGESAPVLKQPGDSVIGGTLNSDSALVISVTATGAATQLSAIERLAGQAADEKPAQVTIADRIARFFIARLLIICACVFAFWLWYDSARALWVTLSVLVVTCPCALALAMPAALSAATANLRKQGFLVARGHVIESLTEINRVIFDKTGTLTKGKFAVEQLRLCAEPERTPIADDDHYLAIAAALEAASTHPLAAAFKPWAGRYQALQAKQVTAAGVEGVVNDVHYRLGAVDFVQQGFAQPVMKSRLMLPDDEKLWVLLGDEQGPLAWIALADEVRAGAADLINDLHRAGVAVELLSGDQSGAVAKLAQQLNIEAFTSAAKPDDKLARLREAQQRGDKVLMLGDGINDVPILSGADISVAMASASDLAQTRADSVLLNDNLGVLYNAILLARRTRRIIKQNLRFSLTYNLLAVPLAAAGLVPPYIAAIGMTMSSLIVIFNSLRLTDSSVKREIN